MPTGWLGRSIASGWRAGGWDEADERASKAGPALRREPLRPRARILHARGSRAARGGGGPRAPPGRARTPPRSGDPAPPPPGGRALTCGRSCRWPPDGGRPLGRWGSCTAPPGRYRRPRARPAAAAAEPRPPGCGTSPSRGQARRRCRYHGRPGPARPPRHGRDGAALTFRAGPARPKRHGRDGAAVTLSERAPPLAPPPSAPSPGTAMCQVGEDYGEPTSVGPPPPPPPPRPG